MEPWNKSLNGLSSLWNMQSQKKLKPLSHWPSCKYLLGDAELYAHLQKLMENSSFFVGNHGWKTYITLRHDHTIPTGWKGTYVEVKLGNSTSPSLRKKTTKVGNNSPPSDDFSGKENMLNDLKLQRASTKTLKFHYLSSPCIFHGNS